MIDAGNAGAHGISFFFLLSGAMLAYNGRATDLRRYYIKRVARIYPVYLVAFVVGLVVRIGVDHGAGFVTPKLVLANALMLQCWFPNANLSVPPTAWTLSDEAFFYVLLPLILAALLRTRHRTALGAFLLLVAMVLPGIVMNAVGSEYFLSPLSRLPEFAAGCCLGLALPELAGRADIRRRVNPILGAAGVAWLALMLLYPQLPTWLTATGPLDLVFVVTIVAGAAADLGGRNWLSSRRLVALGLWSYAFYSFHASALAVVFPIFHKPPTSFVEGAVAAGIVFVATWFAAALLYRWFEEPLRERIGRARPVEAIPANSLQTSAHWQASGGIESGAQPML